MHLYMKTAITILFAYIVATVGLGLAVLDALVVSNKNIRKQDDSAITSYCIPLSSESLRYESYFPEATLLMISYLHQHYYKWLDNIGLQTTRQKSAASR